KQRIQILTNKVFDELKNNIKNEQVPSKLEDKGYYNNRINEIRKEFLTNNQKLKDLYIFRRWKLDLIQSETEDKIYDITFELINSFQNLNELNDNSELAKDILKLNEILLTENRKIDNLIAKRKQNYNNKLNDNFVVIASLRQPPSPKQPAAEDENEDDIYLFTRIIDNAKSQRNYNRNEIAQILWIVDEYKKTLNKDDKRKFTLRAKTNHVKDLIKDSYTK
ncbi:4235_t:CDS:2, partial [Racocetra persica]